MKDDLFEWVMPLPIAIAAVVIVGVFAGMLHICKQTDVYKNYKYWRSAWCHYYNLPVTYTWLCWPFVKLRVLMKIVGGVNPATFEMCLLEKRLFDTMSVWKFLHRPPNEVRSRFKQWMLGRACEYLVFKQTFSSRATNRYKKSMTRCLRSAQKLGLASKGATVKDYINNAKSLRKSREVAEFTYVPLSKDALVRVWRRY